MTKRAFYSLFYLFFLFGHLCSQFNHYTPAPKGAHRSMFFCPVVAILLSSVIFPASLFSAVLSTLCCAGSPSLTATSSLQRRFMSLCSGFTRFGALFVLVRALLSATLQRPVNPLAGKVSINRTFFLGEMPGALPKYAVLQKAELKEI
jgi:hypothetical protein